MGKMLHFQSRLRPLDGHRTASVRLTFRKQLKNILKSGDIDAKILNNIPKKLNIPLTRDALYWNASRVRG